MSELEYMRLGLRILDEQLVDRDGRRCGRVEDLELDGGPGARARLQGLLCGATAWKRRLPPWLSELIPSDPANLRRVSWDDVEEIANEIILRRSESDLQRAAEGQEAPLAISRVIGARVVSGSGDGVGRVADVVASRPKDHGDGGRWELHGLLLGRGGMLQRAGFRPMLQHDMERGDVPENLVAWRRVQRFDDQDRLVVTGVR